MASIKKIISLLHLITISLFASEISISQYNIFFSGFSDYDLDLGFKTANFTLLSPFSINLDELDQNDVWELFIQSTEFYPSNYGFSLSQIEWKQANKNNDYFKPLSIDKQLITNSNHSRSQYIELNFRIKINWETLPGSYDIPFKITLENSKRFSNKKKTIRGWSR